MDQNANTSTASMQNEVLGPGSSNVTPASSQPSPSKPHKIGPVFRVVEVDRRKRDFEQNETADKYDTPVDTIPEEERKLRGDLFADVSGPVWHKISNVMITRPIIGENLHLQFKDLPIYGAPDFPAKLFSYEDKRIRDFVGFNLDDTEYAELKNICNPDNLRTGKELKMTTSYPSMALISKNTVKDGSDSEDSQLPDTSLKVLQRLRKRVKVDSYNTFPKLLKYRGVKQFPLREQEDQIPGRNMEPPDLEPGVDVLYRIRVFRPFAVQLTGGEKQVRGRHSVFNCDIVMPGRQALTALRDRFSCRNDLDLRLDMSLDPDHHPTVAAKYVFPSGFMFINNVFYVDGRPGCRDTSEPVRRWARARGLGAFPVRPMHSARLHDVRVRLAHPEVYVHQGACEHVFLFSEVRLLNRSDPLHLAAYPCHSLMSQNQSIYCTTCAEFAAKWLVTGLDIVPFDPAFFCDVCFRQYLYRDGARVADFKAFPYRGNELVSKNPCQSKFAP